MAMPMGELERLGDVSPEANDEFAVQWPKSIRKLRETWEPYRQATWGLRNHWYPVCFSRELQGVEPRAQTLLGEPVIFRRVAGKIYALEDRCAHRRVPLSTRFACHTKDTVTCWYHGFTYNWKDGLTVQVMTDPQSEAIGKVGLKTYSVEEVKGVVFVFIGDNEPPPLSDDLPPTFLDENRVIHGRRIRVGSNWRWAAENAIDSVHTYVHRNSRLWDVTPSVLPMGLKAVSDHATALRYTGPGAKGILDDVHLNYHPVWSVDIGEEKDVVQGKMKEDWDEFTIMIPQISIWLPAGSAIACYPKAEWISYEFYVPIDATNHDYFQLMSGTCANEQEANALREEIDEKWIQLGMEDFNGDDVWAREGLEVGYAQGDGWNQEFLVHNDTATVAWRQFVSRYHRGIQPPPPGQKD